MTKILLKGGKEYEPDSVDVADWIRAYPQLDVPQMLRNMENWSRVIATESKRWTPRGARTGVVRWLIRESNKIQAKRNSTPYAAPASYKKFEPEKPKVMSKEVGMAALAALKRR